MKGKRRRQGRTMHVAFKSTHAPCYNTRCVTISKVTAAVACMGREDGDLRPPRFYPRHSRVQCPTTFYGESAHGSLLVSPSHSPTSPSLLLPCLSAFLVIGLRRGSLQLSSFWKQPASLHGRRTCTALGPWRSIETGQCRAGRGRPVLSTNPPS